ncbi:hypothetical protein BJ138DRAFT_1159742, partial [Hygrophoropsis aurantiaca]
MPPKRASARAGAGPSAPAPAAKSTPPVKVTPTAKSAPAAKPAPATKPITEPEPTPAPVEKLAPPSAPIETPSDKVRKEWYRFVSTWYETEKKKKEDDLMKELNIKFKNAKSKAQRQARDDEKDRRQVEIVHALAEPAREQWEQHLENVHLREEDWKIEGEEQAMFLKVFAGLFPDGEEPDSSTLDTIEEYAEADVEIPVTATTKPSPSPTTATFEFVNPMSFTGNLSPPNHSQHLPALPVDLTSLTGGLNGGRHQAIPVTPSASGGLGFETWSSEATLLSTSFKSPAEPSSSRLAPPDKMSRQTSTASTVPSPSVRPNKAQPQTSSSKQSPPSNPESLRYIGPELSEKGGDRQEAEAEFMEFKLLIRKQMICEFHEEAAEIEMNLVEKLSTPNLSSEVRRKELYEHEQKMLQLRELKEIRRKKLSADERERRLGEYKQRAPVEVESQAIHATWQPPTRETVEVYSSLASSSKISQKQPEKSAPPKASGSGWASAPKQSAATSASAAAKLEIPGILKKTASNRSQDEALPMPGVFDPQTSSASASLAKAKLKKNMSSTMDLPSLFNKSDSTSSWSWGDPADAFAADESVVAPASPAPVDPPPTPEPVPTPPTVTVTAGKGKKGKKGQPVKQTTPVPPPPAPAPPEIKVEPPPPPMSTSTASQKAPIWGSSSKTSAATIPTKAAPTPPPSSSATKGKQPVKKGGKQTVPASRAVTVEEVEDADDDWSSIAVRASKASPAVKAQPTVAEEEEDEEEAWQGGEEENEQEEAGAGMSWGDSYWGNLTEGRPVAQVDEKQAKQVRWMPSVDADEASDEEEEE